MGMGTVMGTGMGDRDRQHQLDVSDRKTDSVGRMCRTERRTASDGRIGQERTTSDRRVEQRDGQHRMDVLDGDRWR